MTALLVWHTNVALDGSLAALAREIATLYLVDHPNRLGVPLAAAIAALGLASIATNYLADAQRQRVRATGGRCLVWGKPPALIRAAIAPGCGGPGESLLLASGFWGVAPHFHYVPGLVATFFWTLPARFVHGLPCSISPCWPRCSSSAPSATTHAARPSTARRGASTGSACPIGSFQGSSDVRVTVHVAPDSSGPGRDSSAGRGTDGLGYCPMTEDRRLTDLVQSSLARAEAAAVSSFLNAAADAIVRGGEAGIFTPMFSTLARKR